MELDVASPFAKWRAGTATSPSSRWRRSSRTKTRCGSASAVWPASRWCAGLRAKRPPAPSPPGPTRSKATRTCMHRRRCGATCFAIWGRLRLRRRSDAPREPRRARVSLTLNGRKLAAEAEPRTLLCDFLRHALGATGTHVGCEHGVCGACTVLIDGVATRSCLTLAIQAEGREVKTV